MCAQPHIDDVAKHLKDTARQVNLTMERVLDSAAIAPDLRPVLVYTLQSPGKRVRSVLVLWCCELVSGRVSEEALAAATAIEMVHTYSLVHDDLPAMDNDDLRRGRPTCHKAFDEATAVLAGDALLTLAFEVLADRVQDPGLSVQLIRELARAAGPSGIIAGQLADLRAEHVGGDLQALRYIHTHKTAKMFGCATAMGALCGGADRQQQQSLADFGLALGLVFQITDDILDVSASSGQLGKTAGKDQKAGKLTYPALVGLDQSRQIARDLTDQAVASLASFGPKAKANLLRSLATTLLDRDR
jgi:geranylgeranyl diphosphate synthase type II